MTRDKLFTIIFYPLILIAYGSIVCQGDLLTDNLSGLASHFYDYIFLIILGVITGMAFLFAIWPIQKGMAFILLIAGMLPSIIQYKIHPDIHLILAYTAFVSVSAISLYLLYQLGFYQRIYRYLLSGYVGMLGILLVLVSHFLEVNSIAEILFIAYNLLTYGIIAFHREQLPSLK